MTRAEKACITLYAMFLFVYLVSCAAQGRSPASLLLPVHLPGLAVSVPLFMLVFNDVYRRRFKSPNTKVTWTIAMLVFWPTIAVYLVRHGFRPR